MSSVRITLDNPVFAGRLRDFGRGTPFVHQPQQKVVPRGISDIYVDPKAKINRVIVPVTPAKPRLERSEVLQRKITETPKLRKSKNSTSISQKVLVGMASFVFLSGLFVAFLGIRTNKHVEAQVKEVTQKAVAAEESSLPNETKPDDAAMAGYTVAPDLPRYIRISKIGVYARITSQGVDSKGALKAPGNVYNAGWYNQSTKPGQPGAMLLDGHVSGPTQKGVFYRIKNLETGDKIEVERGDGQKYSYTVVSSQIYNAKDTDMKKAVTPIKKEKPGLNMITCTGKFDTKSGDYPQRVIVFASQD